MLVYILVLTFTNRFRLDWVINARVRSTNAIKLPHFVFTVLNKAKFAFNVSRWTE